VRVADDDLVDPSASVHEQADPAAGVAADLCDGAGEGGTDEGVARDAAAIQAPEPAVLVGLQTLGVSVELFQW